MRHVTGFQRTIVETLRTAANTTGRLIFYSPGQLDRANIMSYRELYQNARDNARKLQALPGWRSGQLCLVNLDDHRSNIVAFWSVVLAKGVPAMTGPLRPGDAQTRLEHLRRLLHNPLFLTTETWHRSEFAAFSNLVTVSFASLEAQETPPEENSFSANDTALPFATVVLMLTSGSSGNPKAVPLSHHQILHCVQGKMDAIPCSPESTILNWVGMDHVAGLVEGHIRGVFGCGDQIQVEAFDIVSNPAVYIELLARHRVSTSFAPNFLIARIVSGLEQNEFHLSPSLDLTCLRSIASGGEPCATNTCHRLAQLMGEYGAPNNVVVPGFGMTETGAGCIFNFSCPRSDLEENYEFTSVGQCVNGVELRITPLYDAESADTINYTRPTKNVVGNVEIRGHIVFNGYFNNEEANLASFTPDNWFRTGDVGFIDHRRNLVLTGRTSELMCINGVKHVPTVQERIIEDMKIPGVTPEYVVCFSWRPKGYATEQCVLVYQHSYAANDKSARAEAQRMISKAVLLNTGTRPYVLPLPPSILHKSSLGKLSRSKIRKQFEEGGFAAEKALNDAIMQEVTSSEVVQPANDKERTILNIVASSLQLDPDTIGVEMPFFNAGLTSIDLIKMRSKICQAFKAPGFSIKSLITQNTVRKLAQTVLANSPEALSYQPVVQLKSTGSKTPLWLIHPGVGEVLVSIGLSQHIQDRPVFALRARGFEEGEEVFCSLHEVVSTYVGAIRAQQPHGPYALAGYSYGSMLAFQIAKRLEEMDETVPFLGCFNLPPHIKSRMQQMSQQNCLAHLAQFLQLVTEEQAADLEIRAAGLCFEDAITLILATSDQARWHELDLTREGLKSWAQVAFSLQSLAVDHEPSGTVQNMDVFWCDPLAIAARSRNEWREVHLARWGDFCRSPPVFHAVEGTHYTMLTSAYVRTFQKTLSKALCDREI